MLIMSLQVYIHLFWLTKVLLSIISQKPDRIGVDWYEEKNGEFSAQEKY